MFNLMTNLILMAACIVFGVMLGLTFAPLPKHEPEVTCHTFDIETVFKEENTIAWGVMEMCVTDIEWKPIWQEWYAIPPQPKKQGSLQ
jgi:hypothetical protein